MTNKRKTWLLQLFLTSLVVVFSLKAHAQYVNIPITGFNNDIVANGVGATNTVSTGTIPGVTYPTIGVDGNGPSAYCFVDNTYKWYSGTAAFPTCGLPNNNIIPSSITSGLNYQLQSYSANNALTIASNTYSGSVLPTTGTMVLNSPTIYGKLYILYETVLNTAGPTITATVTFTDATTQVFANNSVVNWFTNTNTTYSNMQRTNNAAPGLVGTCGAGPYLFEMPLTISPANFTKQIQSVTINWSTPTGSAVNTVDYFHFMALGGMLPCATPANQSPSFSTALTAASTSSITGVFTAAPSAPSGYLVVRYPTGAAVTSPQSGTTYSAGNTIGLGTVVQSGASTTLTATGLTPNTTYDFYVYSYNTGGTCAGPVYNITSPLSGTQTTLACGGPTVATTVPIGPGLPNTLAGGFTTIANALGSGFGTSLGSTGTQAPIILELQSGYTSEVTTTTLTISSNACFTATNNLIIRPATGANGLVISSSVAGPTIDFDGAKYVTIDGTPGGTSGSPAMAVTAAGSNNSVKLNIKNTSATGEAIRLKNDASNNTIKYCDLQGANTAAPLVSTTTAQLGDRGIVFIGTTTGIFGNDNNLIDRCNIHPTTAGAAVNMGIYSYSTQASAPVPSFNDANFITNNNIYDIYGGTTLGSTGIGLAGGTDSWTISGNSFFQTATRTPALTASVVNRAIFVCPTNPGTGSGNNFTISGNFIGGTTVACGSTAMTSTATGAFNNQLTAIELSVNAGTASNVVSNTIANVNITQAASTGDIFRAIAVTNNGNVNVGGTLSTDGNTIGSSTATSSIVLTTASAAPSHCILVSGGATNATTILVKYNKIGGVRTAGTGASLTGIFCNSTASITMDNNLIGSTTVANSFEASGNTATAQMVNGIRIPSGSCTANITNNTICNLNNNSTSTTSVTGNSTTVPPQTGGIIITGSTTTAIINSISNNIIRNLSNAAPTTSNLQSAALVGIGCNSTSSTACTIDNNIIDSLVSTSTATATAIIFEGIVWSGSNSGTNFMTRNLIHSYDHPNAVNPSVTFRGIEFSGGVFTVANNMIRLGIKADGTSFTTPAAIYGIIQGNANQNFYHNSVYIGGSNVVSGASNNSFAFNRLSATLSDIRDNVFVNTRSNSTGTGKHYAFYLGAAATSLTLNYNVYYANGIGGFMGFNGSSDVSAYTSGWIAGDANSLNLDPQFLNPNGKATIKTGVSAAQVVDLHINPSISTPVEATGISIATVTTDFDGQTRSTLGPVDMGADAGVFTAVPPCSAPVVNPTSYSPALASATSSTVTGTITPVTADGYLVVRYLTGATPTTPTLGTTYTVGASLGAGVVVSVGTSTSFTANGLFGATTYDFYTYAYNFICTGTAPNYQTTNPLMSSVTTVGCAGANGIIDIGPGSVSTYNTISAAITGLNLATNGIGSGGIIFELLPSYAITTENISITAFPCLGPTRPITIRPASSVSSAVTITSANATATIDLNGANYVTIDGRPGGSGSSVMLNVINTLGTAPAIRLINDASNNTVKYTDLQSNNSGVTTSSTGGVVLISNTVSSNGNDNNTFDYCNIHNASGGNPIMAVNGLGTTTTTATYNDGNAITNCNISDYFSATLADAAIYVGAGNSGWNISNNHFFQTSTRTYTAAVTHRVLWITPNASGTITAGSGFTINSNYIGGNAANGTGRYAVTGAVNYQMLFVDLFMGFGTATAVKSNTITNLDITTTSTSNSMGFQLNRGNIDLGDASGTGGGNTFGSVTTNSAITYTASTTAATGGLFAIRTGDPTAANTYNVNNNLIGGIDMIGSATTVQAPSATLVNLSGGWTVNCNGNIIGSTTVANSIYYTQASASAATASTFGGIICNNGAGTPVYNINNNIVANITSNYASSTSNATTLKGIRVEPTTVAGSYTCTGNQVYNIKSNVLNNANTTTSSAIIGMVVNTTIGTAFDISNNKVYNLQLTNATSTAAMNVIGMYVSDASTGTNTISRNFIHSLKASNAAAIITGIECGGGISTYSNNLIRLGIDDAGSDITVPCIIRGIRKNTTANNNFYFNTVYIGGLNVTSGSNSTYGFIRTTSASATNDIIKNNIFANVRSNATATTLGANHFAIGLSSGITFLTEDNNDYYANGTDGVLGVISGTTFGTTLALWKLYSTMDLNSYADNPLFNNPTGTASTVNLHINAGTTPTNLESQGAIGTGITIDYDNQTRPGGGGTSNGGGTIPDIGADEFDGVPKLPPVTPANPTQAGGTPTCSSGSVITATGSAPSGEVWYWQYSNNATSTALPATTPLTVYANGTYYINSYNPTTLLWSNASGSIVVSNFPAGPSAPPTPVALDNPADPSCGTTISVTAAPGGVTYYWQGTSPNSTSVANNASSTYAVTSAGTYYVNAQDNSTQCWSTSSSVSISFLASLSSSTFTTTQIVSCASPTGAISISASGSATVYNNNFSSSSIPPTQATLAGANSAITTLNVPALGINSGVLQFTQAVNSQSGGILINNLTGLSSNDFQIDFDMITTTGGGSAADGFSYSYGDDVIGLPTNTAVTPSTGNITTLAPENGSGSKLKFSFDAISNTGGCTSGAPASVASGNQPGVYLMYNCTVTHQGGTPNLCPGVLNFDPSVWWRASATSGAVTHVTIQLNDASVAYPNGSATLTMTGTAGNAAGQSFGPVSYALPAGYLTANKATWKHAFCARTGGLNEGHYIDNLSIQYANVYQYRLVGASTGTTAWQSSQNFTGLAADNYTVQIRYQSNPNCITTLGTTTITAPPSSFATTSNANNVCPATSIGLALSPTFAGATYTWQSAPDVAGAPGTFTPISGAANAGSIAVTGQTSTTWYRCNVVCAAIGLNTNSTPVQVISSSFIGCYCVPTITNATTDEEITNVTLGTINNTSTCGQLGTGTGSVAGSYANYSSGAGAPAATNIIAGSPTPFSITVGSCGTTNFSSGVAIFMDLNHNGVFTDANEMVWNNGASANIACVPATVLSNTLTVNAGATSGLTVMRVVDAESTAGSSITPCATYGYGEFEDYLVNIISPPAIPANPTEGAIPTICNVGTVVNPTGLPSSANITWYWQTSSTGTSTANIAATSTTATPLAIYANGTYYIRAYDATSLTWSVGSGSVTVTDFPLAANPGTPVATYNCNATSISPASAPTGGTNYYWQTSRSAISTSLNANTPYVATTIGKLYIKAQDAGGCWSNADSISYIVFTTLSGTYSTTQPVTCASGGAINIQANGAGTVFNSQFPNSSLPTGVTTSGNATWINQNGNGVLQLTANAGSQTGTIQILNNTGIASKDFQVDFDFITSGPAGTTFAPFTAADGLSYSYGDDVSTTFNNVANAGTNIGTPSGTPVGNAAEGGSGTKLKISFDPFANGASTIGNGNNSDGIYFMYNCTQYFNSTLIQNGVLDYQPITWWRATSTQTATPVNTTHVNIVMTSAGTATLTLTGTSGNATGQSYTHTVNLPASYLTADQSTWKHVFAARTGGNWEGHFIDNMVVQYSILEYQLVGTTTGATAWQSSANFTSLAPDTYAIWVRYNDGNGHVGCSTLLGSTTISGPPPFTSATTINSCYPNVINYTATSSDPSASFTWSRAAVPGISNAAASGSSATINETLINTTNAPITVTYVYTLVHFGCTTQNVVVTVNPTISGTISGGANLLVGQNTNLSLNFVGTAPWTYLLSDGTTGTTSSASNTINVTPAVATNYTITSLTDAYCTLTNPTYLTGNALVDVHALNDSCTTAFSLSVTAACNYTAGTSINGYPSTPASTCSGVTADDDVWYTFYKPAGMISANVKVLGGANYDPAFEVLSGNCTTMNSIACVNSNASTTNALENFTILGLPQAAGTYFVRVYDARVGAGSGNFSICVNGTIPAPINDDPCGSVNISANSAMVGNCSNTVVAAYDNGNACYNGVANNPTSNPPVGPNMVYYVGTTAYATSLGASEPTPPCGVAGATPKSIWYKFKAPTMGGVSIDLRTSFTGNPTNFNTIIALYAASGNPCTVGTTYAPIACSTNGTLSVSAITLAPYSALGQDLYVQLIGQNSTFGNYMLSLQGTTQNISVANPTSGSMQVTFPTVTGASSIRLYWRPVSGTGYSVISLSPSNSTYTITGLQSGVNYRVWAAFVNANQVFYTQWQTLSTTFGCTGAPPAPTVTAIAGHCSRVKVWWPVHSSATSSLPYRLYYRVVGSSGFNVVACTTDSFFVNNLALNTNYEFFYRVICTGGNQINSLVATYTTCAGPAKQAGAPLSGNGGILEHNGRYLVDVDFPTLATYADNTVADGNVHEVNLSEVNNIDLNGPDAALVQTVNIEEGMNGSFNLIPNPTNGNVTIDYALANEGDVMIRITDVQGKVVKEQLVSNAAKSGSVQIDLTEMNSGVYLVNVKGTGYNETKRLVVTK